MYSLYIALYSAPRSQNWAETSSLSQINTYCFQAGGPHVRDPCQVFSHWNLVHMFSIVCSVYLCVCVWNQQCGTVIHIPSCFEGRTGWWDRQRRDVTLWWRHEVLTTSTTSNKTNNALHCDIITRGLYKYKAFNTKRYHLMALWLRPDMHHYIQEHWRHVGVSVMAHASFSVVTVSQVVPGIKRQINIQ